MRKSCLIVMLVAVVAAAAPSVSATVYNVGPGQTYANIVDVPWESITAGDTVNIYYRATPYKEKFITTGAGTASQPILIHGVPGPGGELPILDGQDAVSRQALAMGSEARGLITMQQGDSGSYPTTCHPSYIILENLEIKNASVPYSFTDDAGVIQSYVNSSAAWWMTDGSNITCRNCYFHHCGNGFFTYSEGDGSTCWTENILVEGNYIDACGNAGSLYEHTSYTESCGITFQYNHYGPPRGSDTVSTGNGLKDRSAGLVVRYNWIDGGNRCLDIIDCEDSDRLGLDPLWDKTYFYGNVLIERNDVGNRQTIHFGADMHAEPRHKGYFYNNTVVSYRAAYTTLVRESGTADGFFDVRNCIIFVTADGINLEIANDSRRCGPINMRNLFMKPGYRLTGSGGGTVNDYDSHVLGSDPGWVDFNTQDFRLASGSGCINAGTTLHADASAYPVDRQYVKHQSSEVRPSDGILDIGAFEAAGGPPADLVITTTSLPAGNVGVAYSQAIAATGGVPAYSWSVISGSLPGGLSLGSSTGVVSGTPTAAGTSYFTVQVSDSQQPADTDTQALSIVVTAAPPAPTITTTSLPNGTRGVAYSQTVQATGGTLPYTWTKVAGTLPNGLTLNASTGVISGTPSKKGTFNFTVRCTDAAMQYDEQALTIIIL